MTKNNLITLRKKFNEKLGPKGRSKPNLRKKSIVTSASISKIIKDIENVQNYWTNISNEGKKIVDKDLVLITYTELVAKSNRVQKIFKEKGHKPTDTIVGAKFEKYIDEDNKKEEGLRHQITYYVSQDAIKNTLDELQNVKLIIDETFNGKIDRDLLLSFNKGNLKVNDLHKLSKTTFAQLVVDTSFVEKIEPPVAFSTKNLIGEVIVNLYDLHNGKQTYNQTRSLLFDLGIYIDKTNMLDNTTVKLSAHDLEKIQQEAPYLVAMGDSNLNDYKYELSYGNNNVVPQQMPKSKDEPVIGVIDSNFYGNNYFGNWVESENLADIVGHKINHGTEVTSIIVDGPTLNPDLDDGCGRFKVRHFGIMKDYNSSFEVIKQIDNIIKKNRDIKVWNFSYGSESEVNPNFISSEGYFLDKLQIKYNDIIFVVSGTNKADSDLEKKIGAPADSLNSLVVNSVDMHGNITDYDRHGPVLSFFVKPDVAYYGGTKKKKLRVIGNDGTIIRDYGTSFAAPWIARKLSFLIQKMGMTREEAKALIIDSAVSWDGKVHDVKSKIGYGVVPIKIEDVLQSESDEIKFIVSGESESYDTYSDGIPIPTKDGKFPYKARATMVYFPECTRNQGVDYTNTELDLHFGRVKDTKIIPINDNKQTSSGFVNIPESVARSDYRKWDNIKIIREEITSRSKPSKAYKSPMWEISVKSKERLSNHKDSKVRFSIVVTMKNLNKENKNDTFIQECKRAGWIANEVEIPVRLRMNEQASEDIDLDTNPDN